MKGLKRITERRFEDLAQAMREEMGAPISMARSAQADAALGHLESFIGALAELKERTLLDSRNFDLPLNRTVIWTVNEKNDFVHLF